MKILKYYFGRSDLNFHRLLYLDLFEIAPYRFDGYESCWELTIFSINVFKYGLEFRILISTDSKMNWNTNA